MVANAHRLRRVAAVIAAFLALGIGIHGAAELLEHGHGAESALVVCMTALALLTTIGLTRPGGKTPCIDRLVWVALPQALPTRSAPLAGRSSAAWLKRFQN